MLTADTTPPALDEVHWWLIDLAAGRGEVAELRTLLAPDEQERAARFYFERDRASYVVARARLRQILAGYLRVEPRSLRFGYLERGKPYLVPGTPGELCFNLSHSGGLALVGVTTGAEIGVDVEQHRDGIGLVEIARRYFSPREVAIFNSLDQGEQRAAFYRCWTRKEAYLKARGDGLALGLDRFDVSLGPGEPAALLQTLDDPLDAARWRLYDCTVPAGYNAAIAVAGPAHRLVQFKG